MSLYLLWLLAAGAGFYALMNYQNAEGSTGVTPEHWPAGAKITLDPQKDTLIMFAHPQCPCTRASMEELNRVMARCQGKAAAQVWFFSPSQMAEDWTKAGLWRSALAIPGVAAHEDRAGAQARVFGAETSGYVLLYDTRGQLLFKGGITGSRGHAGDNAGESAVISLVTGESTTVKQTKTYGCSLLDKCDAPASGDTK